MIFFRSLLILILMIALSACIVPKRIYSGAEILQIASDRVTAVEGGRIEVPFAITPEMAQFARDATRDKVTHVRKAIALVEAMISKWDLEITYDSSADMTAHQVFFERRANCMSFTNLFIGLSRSLGMDTAYVDVPQLSDYSIEGNIILNNGHMCAGLWDGGEFYLVDFSPDPEKHYRIYRIIDDLEAIAHHYNNLGYRVLRENPAHIDEAIRYYRISTEIKPGFPPGHNNLGAAYASRGDLDQARFHYECALEHDPQMAEANCNMGSLFFTQGRLSEAKKHFEKAVSAAKDNSHYHYRLGMTDYFLGDFRSASRHFIETIRIDERFTSAYIGLALIEERLLQYDTALEHLEKALSIQPGLSDATSRYNNIMLKASLVADI